MSTATVSSAPDTKLFDSPLPLKIGNVTYEMSMLTDRDYGDITQYMRAVYLAIAYEAGDLLKDAIKKRELVSIVLNELPNIGWGTEKGVNLLNSYDRTGYLRVGFQMCRKRHPNLTFEVFEKEARRNEADTLSKINDCLSHFSPEVFNSSTDGKQEDSGGSSTENDKSAGSVQQTTD